MNLEDSKGLLIKAVQDLANKRGECLQIMPTVTQDLVDKCPDFSQTTKIAFYLEGRYVLLHCDSADGGDFTTHGSAHSLINWIHHAVILAWANEEA